MRQTYARSPQSPHTRLVRCHHVPLVRRWCTSESMCACGQAARNASQAGFPSSSNTVSYSCPGTLPCTPMATHKPTMFCIAHAMYKTCPCVPCLTHRLPYGDGVLHDDGTYQSDANQSSGGAGSTAPPASGRYIATMHSPSMCAFCGTLRRCGHCIRVSHLGAACKHASHIAMFVFTHAAGTAPCSRHSMAFRT